MPERKPEQLHGNVMFALEDAGILSKESVDVLPILEDVTVYLQKAILASRPDTRLYFIDDQSNRKLDIALSEIALDDDGRPLFVSTVGVEPFRGDIHEFALFSWKNKDGQEYSAAYPHIAFYTPDQ